MSVIGRDSDISRMTNRHERKNSMTGNDESKLKELDALIRRGSDSIVPSSTSQQSALAGLEERSENLKTQQLDLIGRFQANKIERKSAVEQLRAIHQTRLEAAKFALGKALEVEKGRIDLVANKYLYQITQEYLQDMAVMGLSNEESRSKTLFALNNQTTKALLEAQAAQWPETLKNKTINSIMKRYEDFSNNLMDGEKKS
jgi:hypothetical protein